jgi:1-acyl-sn-glycerol-3-phosphate acyltransferase
MAEWDRGFRRLANPVLRTLFNLIYDIELSGIENVPAKGPFIAIMNHIYFVDPVLVGVLAPRHIVIMSKIENYRILPLRPFLHLYGCFPVRRGEMDLQAIRRSLEVLEHGDGLLMAPEGTRSKSKTLQQGLDGVAWLALRTDAPIVPVAHTGQEHLGSSLKTLRRAPLRMVFGEPFRFRSPAGMGRKENLRLMTTEAMYRLAALLPEQYRGIYSDLSSASSSTLIPLDRSPDV